MPNVTIVVPRPSDNTGNTVTGRPGHGGSTDIPAGTDLVDSGNTSARPLLPTRPTTDTVSEDELAGQHALPRGDVFTFTLSGSTVASAGVQLPDGTTVTLPTKDNVSFSVEGADILATRTVDHGQQIARFSDTDGDGLYEIVAHAHVITEAASTDQPRPTLDVTLSADGSSISEIVRTLRDGTEKVLLSSTVSNEHVNWSLDSGLLVQVITNDAGKTHWGVFRDGNGDGVFTLVADGNGEMITLTGIISATDAVAGTL